MKGLVWVSFALVTLAVAGCRDDRPRGDADAGTPPPGVDAGGTVVPPPPPSGLSLAIERASFAAESGGRADLTIGLRMANGASGAPAPLDPGRFAVRSAGGAEIAGSRGGASAPCGPDLSVGAGGSVACSAVFSVPTGETPVELIYRSPDMREARAPIAACGPGTPSGLCAAGQVCSGGTCVGQCSPTLPTGACPSSAELCVDGACTAACSPSVPDGACATGLCRDGSCTTSCDSFVLDDTCFTCVDDVVIDGICAFPEGCDDYCAVCPGESGTTCSCVEEDRCQFCEGLPSFWFCVLDNCAECRT